MTYKIYYYCNKFHKNIMSTDIVPMTDVYPKTDMCPMTDDIDIIVLDDKAIKKDVLKPKILYHMVYNDGACFTYYVDLSIFPLDTKTSLLFDLLKIIFDYASERSMYPPVYNSNNIKHGEPIECKMCNHMYEFSSGDGYPYTMPKKGPCPSCCVKNNILLHNKFMFCTN